MPDILSVLKRRLFHFVLISRSVSKAKLLLLKTGTIIIISPDLQVQQKMEKEDILLLNRLW
jgi:hypothetical protein